MGREKLLLPAPWDIAILPAFRETHGRLAISEPPMLCFIHIERTAGTTFHRILANNYPYYVLLKSWQLWSNSEANDFTCGEYKHLKQILPWTEAIGGHSLREYLRYEEVFGEKVQYLTFVRDPVTRYLSQFRYQRDVMRLGWTLESFVAEPRFNNYMTHRIARNGDVEQAKRTLRENFAFVGLKEDFDRSLLLMAEALEVRDFDTRYEICNASSDARRSQDQELAAPLRARIAENNALDLELYRFVKEELFPSYLQAAPGDLEARLVRHREAKQGFRFSRPRRFLQTAFLKAVHRPVEKVIRNLHHDSRRAA